MDNHNVVDVKQVELNKLEWSSTSFKVGVFLTRFPLPQVVKVIEGFYGEDEESSLGADQVLTLHVLKSTDKLVGRDYRGKEVNVPLNCSSKVEVRPSNLKDVYESVEELCSAFPNHVRVSQGYYSVAKDEEILNVGDKLRLKSVDKSKKFGERLVCVNQNGQTIELPRDCVAGFQPLADGKEYYLAEVASRFTLPMYVQFVDPPAVGAKQSGCGENEMGLNSALGSIYLEKRYSEKMVIASTISNDGQRTVVTFPQDIDIRIAVCEGLLQNSRNYAEICRNLNNGVDLTKLSCIDALSAFRPQNSVREYSYKELVTYATPHLTTREEESSAGDGVASEAETSVGRVNDESPVTDEGSGVNEVGPGEEPGTGNRKDENGSEEGKENAGKSPPKPQRVESSPVVERKNAESEPSKPGEPLQIATADEDSPSRQQADEAKSPNSEVAENTTSSSDSKIFVTTVNIVKPSVKKAPDISACSVKQVSDILRELGMAKYVVKFEAEMIDGEMLMSVMAFDDEVLMSDFGLNKLHCMKLRKYLDGWRPKI